MISSSHLFKCILVHMYYCMYVVLGRVSVQGVESLWGDCKFIPADWGS
jgi:hypothetical protein